MFIQKENTIYVIKQYGNIQVEELVGEVNRTESVRIDNETVADITYQFNFETGLYIEQSRTTQNVPLPPAPLSLEERLQIAENTIAALTAIAVNKGDITSQELNGLSSLSEV